MFMYKFMLYMYPLKYSAMIVLYNYLAFWKHFTNDVLTFYRFISSWTILTVEVLFFITIKVGRSWSDQLQQHKCDYILTIVYPLPLSFSQYWYFIGLFVLVFSHRCAKTWSDLQRSASSSYLHHLCGLPVAAAARRMGHRYVAVPGHTRWQEIRRARRGAHRVQRQHA